MCFSMNIYRISGVSEFRLNPLQICVRKNGGISEFFPIDNWKKSQSFHLSKDNITKQYNITYKIQIFNTRALQKF